MFSTVASEGARFLRCYLVSADGERVAVDVPRFLEKYETELRVAPSQPRLQELAERMGGLKSSPVQAELWRYRFDANTEQLKAERMLTAACSRPEVSP